MNILKGLKSCVGCGMCESACPTGVIVMRIPPVHHQL
jgi:ferredoxin